MKNLINALPLFFVLCKAYGQSTTLDYVFVSGDEVKSLRIIVYNDDNFCTINIDNNGYGYWQSSQSPDEDDEILETQHEVLNMVMSFLG